MPVLVWKSNKISTIQKDYIWKPSTCGCETNRYLKSVADDLVITHYEIINVSDTATINVHDKEATCNMDNYYVFSLFFIINHIIINRYHFLLLHKISIKTKIHIAMLIM